jgi:multiple sugar transport system ATP-binding protein
VATVELKNVVKQYPKNAEPTVRGVDLFIKDREFVVLVGPSGCGKSTVLRMIAGLEDLTSGEICIDEKRVNDLHPKDRNIAMVFQNYALFPHLTVRDNIVFGMRIRGKPKAEQDEAVARAASILGLEQLLMRKPGELSGGQRQRVAVGRAIVRHPAVFLFDEPLSNLDAKLRVQMRAEIIKLHRQIETTMVYVTHDQIEAMTMSDRIVVFQGGRIQQVGTPQEVYQHPANRFVAGFIGSPPMNFLEGRIESAPEGSVFVSKRPGGIRLPLGDEPGFIPPTGKDGVTLGLRPEDLHLAQPGPRGLRASVPLTATVEIVEYFGPESNVTLQLGSDSMVMSQKGVAPRSGERFDVVFDLDHLHFFPLPENRGET